MYPTAPRLKRGYADGPAGQVHFYDGGGEGRPLLLVHQAPTSAIDYSAVFPLFAAAGVRVIAPDLPGMGMSDVPSREPTIADYVDAVVSLLDHLGLPIVDVAGHHTGASVALAVAAKQPERVGRIVLYGPPVMSPETLAAHWEAIVPSERSSTLFDVDPEGSHLSSLFQKLAARYGGEAANRMVISRLMAGPTLWYAHNAALTHDVTPDLVKDRHPLLVISHESEMLHACALAAYSLRPDADFVTLATDRPTAMDGAAAEWTDAVLGFIRNEEAV